MCAAQLLEGCRRLLAQLPPNVDLSIQVDDDLTVQVDPLQIEQVLHALVDNAAYAMRDTGGTVRIVADRARPAQKALARAARINSPINAASG